MNDKEMRLNMIKLLAIGIKHANAIISNDEFCYRDLIGEIFNDKNGKPASIEEILENLNNFEDVNYKEEDMKSREYGLKIRKNSLTIDLLKKTMEDLITIE